MKLESSEFDLVIEAGRTERHYWMDLWRYRELFYFLAWRDILVRYKQTVIGIAWALIRPVLAMLVLTVVFGKLARLPSGASDPSKTATPKKSSSPRLRSRRAAQYIATVRRVGE